MLSLYTVRSLTQFIAFCKLIRGTPVSSVFTDYLYVHNHHPDCGYFSTTLATIQDGYFGKSDQS